MKVIVTGTTGMVGEGVLQECLRNPLVTEVLSFSRKPFGNSHPKLKEVIHSDFFDIRPVAAQLSGYDACYFCLGVTSVGKKEDEYTRLTYTLTLHVAEVLSAQNPGMTFCYVSGSGTDSTEQGRLMWARVKGKTENDLMKLPFRQVFAFRPGFLRADNDAQHVLKGYKYIDWIYPIGRKLFPNAFCTLAELGAAMIRVTEHGYFKKTIEVKDIVSLAKAKT
jgi:uncharacterized protein YbjT (DUF2867 family)